MKRELRMNWYLSKAPVALSWNLVESDQSAMWWFNEFDTVKRPRRWSENLPSLHILVGPNQQLRQPKNERKWFFDFYRLSWSWSTCSGAISIKQVFRQIWNEEKWSRKYLTVLNICLAGHFSCQVGGRSEYPPNRTQSHSRRTVKKQNLRCQTTFKVEDTA